jgi:hypothetical protein
MLLSKAIPEEAPYYPQFKHRLPGVPGSGPDGSHAVACIFSSLRIIVVREEKSLLPAL